MHFGNFWAQSWRVVSSISGRHEMCRTSGKTNFYKSLTWDSTSRKLAAPYDSTEVIILLLFFINQNRTILILGYGFLRLIIKRQN